MIQIAADLAKLYTSFMEQKGLETDQHRYYIKWRRYYLDFCHKYKFKRQNKESLSAFLESFVKRPVRTHMLGVVGTEGEKPPATRLYSIFYSNCIGNAIYKFITISNIKLGFNNTYFWPQSFYGNNFLR